MALTYLNDKTVARGLRNNNPFNLVRTNNKWQGKIPFSESFDKVFEQFVELKWGIRAYFKDVIGDINKGANTLTKLLSEFAPSFENNTSGYISRVANEMGISANSVLKTDKLTIIKLAKAMAKVELGNDANLLTDQNYNDAWNVLGSSYTSEVKKTCEHCGAVLGGLAIGLLTWFTLFKI